MNGRAHTDPGDYGNHRQTSSAPRGGVLATAVAVLSVIGCAARDTGHLLFGDETPFFGVEQASQEPGAEGPLLVEGSSYSGAAGSTISLLFSNRTTTPIRLDYLLDQYVVQTFDGQAVVLEKEFLSYPRTLSPGADGSVTLLVPDRLSPANITSLTATVDHGRRTVTLHSADRLFGTEAEDRADRVASAPREQSPPSPAPPIADRAQALGIVHPVSDESELLFAGTVPVTLEFTQALGTTLRTEVRVDEESSVMRLEPGQRRLFHVLPGRHELYFACHMPPLATVQGHVILMATPEQPLRVTLHAIPHLDGVEVTAQVWEGKRMTWDHRFSSGTDLK